MTKMHHEYPKHPKTLECDHNTPKTSTKLPNLLKRQKYRWNLENRKNNLETSENNQNTFQQSQNTLHFLEFGNILLGFMSFCSF